LPPVCSAAAASKILRDISVPAETLYAGVRRRDSEESLLMLNIVRLLLPLSIFPSIAFRLSLLFSLFHFLPPFIMRPSPAARKKED